MASISVSIRTEEHPHLRPLSIFRDLPAVADLIELCFSNTMDTDGRRYVQELRRTGSDNSFLKWANRAAETTSLPLTGYVWEEDGKIIGNASLVPFRHGTRRISLIANVAVHPEYRRRGIGRLLTERAMQHATERKTDYLWLHVREDNPHAVDLYTKLGFVERARRVTWQAGTDPYTPRLQTDITITSRHPRFWTLQKDWLARHYPDSLAWHRNWNFNTLRPGVWNWLYLTMLDANVRQWIAVRENELEAALAWIPQGRGEGLFGATGDESTPEALTALLLQARRDLSPFYPNIQMEFPISRFDGAIQSAGFRALRTLIWMQATP